MTTTTPSSTVCSADSYSPRWMIRRDMPDVLDIESSVFQFPWTENDFLLTLRQRNCIGLVVEEFGKVVGYMVYELQKSRLEVLNLAVHPTYRRHGIGTALIQKLQNKLSTQRRNRIVTCVRETNLDAQFFFRDLGFRAVNTLRDHYEDTEEDAYLFVYRHCQDS